MKLISKKNTTKMIKLNYVPTDQLKLHSHDHEIEQLVQSMFRQSYRRPVDDFLKDLFDGCEGEEGLGFHEFVQKGSVQ